MGHRQWIVRAALVCGLAGAAWTLYDQLDDHQAHAADLPVTVEQPGGLLDRAGRLPEQASDRAREVVDRAKPRKAQDDPPAAGPAKPALPRPKPGKEKPAKDQPGEDAPPPIGDVVDEVREVVDQVEEQLPAPPPGSVITLPSTDPAPLPDAEDVQPAPVVISPVEPAAVAAAPARPPVATAPAGAATARATYRHAELCGHDRDPRDLLRKTKQPARLAPAARSGGAPCPTTPHPDLTDAGPATVAGKRCQLGSDLMAPTAAGLGRPGLQLLRVLWPRADVADSRTEYPEPGPA